MDTWTSYQPADLLMFSETVYWRLFELHNQALWPLPLLMPLIGIIMLILLLRPAPRVDHALPIILAALWCLVALAFIWYRYAAINWAMQYLVPVWLLQAALLLWFGGYRRILTFTWRRSLKSYLGLGLFLYAVLLHPLTVVLAGRPLLGAEIFGLAPDPTAIATLGLVASAGPLRVVWPLLLIPLVWCLVSWVTLYTLGTPAAWVPLLSALVGLTAASVKQQSP